ncbi:MAG: sugar ABC transporter permease [Anaerolineae bacterium]|nr:sugar ABC transporter permease [Anaerolineae bacterium]
MAYSIVLVFQDWDLLTPARFVGLANLERLRLDPKVLVSLWNTAYLTFVGVPLQLLLALALALALNVKLRGIAGYRTVFYLPSITPAVASAVVWLQILHPEFGILNNFLEQFGISRVNWLFDTRAAKPALIFMSLWGVGGAMVIFLAGLQGIPEELYEAAVLDGAGWWSKFIRVTMPLLSPFLFFQMIMGVINGFQANFTTTYIMTGGGPQDATLVTVLYIYRNGFEYFKMGYAASLAWMLFWIIMFFTLIQFLFANRWVYYEVGQ